jgi:hypothetical protein
MGGGERGRFCAFLGRVERPTALVALALLPANQKQHQTPPKPITNKNQNQTKPKPQPPPNSPIIVNIGSAGKVTDNVTQRVLMVKDNEKPHRCVMPLVCLFWGAWLGCFA